MWIFGQPCGGSMRSRTVFRRIFTKNCFYHCLKETVSTNTGTETRTSAETLHYMKRDATDYSIAITQTVLDSLLNHADEEDVVYMATKEEFVQEVVGLEPIMTSYSDAEEQNDKDDIYSIKQQP